MSKPEGNRLSERAVSSRRGFLGTAAGRAAYLAPAVLALTSREAVAGVSGCGQTGSPCSTDLDCCVGWNCQTSMMMVSACM
ncbi:MAG: hypothetical protein HKO59_05055 [Phycisphaerales bacterium]|nr:hypothetical protein [Phycisphaerae bacterium]NNF43526.1 hypothetical protein [Phycisphaerales bacterium]NNM25342.1 hypothetical protein [Phycisphaerales bacterium]